MKHSVPSAHLMFPCDLLTVAVIGIQQLYDFKRMQLTNQAAAETRRSFERASLAIGSQQGAAVHTHLC